MLTSISPLGERARGHDARLSAAFYTLASILGGLTTAAVLGLVGLVLPSGSRPVWAAVACVLAALVDLSGRVPTGHRQVDEDWLTRYRRWVYTTGFGWQLGTGVTTVVTSAATYAWLVLLTLQQSLTAALLVGAAFGLARALPLLLLRADSPAALRQAATRIAGRAGAARGATIGVLLTAGAVLVAS